MWLSLYPLSIGGRYDATRGRYRWQTGSRLPGRRWRSIRTVFGVGGSGIDLSRGEQLAFWTLIDTSVARRGRNPTLVMEVLSPSTEADDRGDKFELYRRSDSLQEYVLVSADKIAIDLHRKDDHGEWKSIYYRSSDTVELSSISLTFPIEKVYRGIKF